MTNSACRPRFLARAQRHGLRRSSRRLFLETLEGRIVLTACFQTKLAADEPGVALVHDPELIDAWGIAINPTGTFWLSARATDVSTVYSGDVTQPVGTVSPFVKSTLTVSVPGGPTGQVFNGSRWNILHGRHRPEALDRRGARGRPNRPRRQPSRANRMQLPLNRPQDDAQLGGNLLVGVALGLPDGNRFERLVIQASQQQLALFGDLNDVLGSGLLVDKLVRIRAAAHRGCGGFFLIVCPAAPPLASFAAHFIDGRADRQGHQDSPQVIRVANLRQPTALGLLTKTGKRGQSYVFRVGGLATATGKSPSGNPDHPLKVPTPQRYRGVLVTSFELADLTRDRTVIGRQGGVLPGAEIKRERQWILVAKSSTSNGIGQPRLPL
jgi:hypothetical protein